MAKKKKTVKKIFKKATKKTVKKVVKKAAKKVTKKTTKKVAKKASPKAKSVKKVQKATKKTVKIEKSLNRIPTVKVDYSKVVNPLGERILVKIENPTERITAGGLIIPATSSYQDGYAQAKVLAVGPGWKSKKGHLHPLDVQVGNQVLFSEYRATKIQFNNEDLFILNESDVLGVVVEK